MCQAPLSKVLRGVAYLILSIILRGKSPFLSSFCGLENGVTVRVRHLPTLATGTVNSDVPNWNVNSGTRDPYRTCALE